MVYTVKEIANMSFLFDHFDDIPLPDFMPLNTSFVECLIAKFASNGICFTFTFFMDLLSHDCLRRLNG